MQRLFKMWNLKTPKVKKKMCKSGPLPCNPCRHTR